MERYNRSSLWNYLTFLHHIFNHISSCLTIYRRSRILLSTSNQCTRKKNCQTSVECATRYTISLYETHFMLSSFDVNCHPYFIYTEISFSQSSSRSHASAHGRETVRMWSVQSGKISPFQVMHQCLHNNRNSNVEYLVMFQTFVQESNLKRHVSTVHGHQEKPFKCDECSMIIIHWSTIIIESWMSIEQRIYPAHY